MRGGGGAAMGGADGGDRARGRRGDVPHSEFVAVIRAASAHHENALCEPAAKSRAEAIA